MIIDFTVNFNNYTEKILNSYRIWKYSCPSCLSKNRFTRHATYERFVNHSFEEEKITILRLKCDSCGATHAILPAGIIPYCFYSIDCLMKILTSYLIDGKSIPRIARELAISEQIISIYLKKFVTLLSIIIEFLRILLNIHLSNDSNPAKILSLIDSNFNYLNFQKEFFIHTKQIFLMTRRRNILSGAVLVFAYI